jgi:hypothetical protein
MKNSNFGNPKLSSEVTKIPIENSPNMSVETITIGVKRESKYESKISSQPPLTKKRFEALLTKSAQPLKPDLRVKGTSEPHPSDGYTDKYTSQDKTVNKEDLRND